MLDPITRLNKRKPHSAFPVVHETKCYGYAAGCEIPSEEQELLMTLDSIHSGFAADVRYPLEEQDLLMTLDSIHSGFAAGCEIPS
jgi:hypothetical protein